MKIKTALDYAMQIAGALAEAHAHGIVHRDLKPGNVMVAEDGRLKLLDFGLAKLTTRADNLQEDATGTMAATQAGIVMGTVAYMSPEQAEGKPVDGRSDIFSFGAVLYEMLSGHRAFAGSSAITTLSAVIDKEPALLPESVPRELKRIVARCLRKSPAERYQQIADVKIALEDYEPDAVALRSATKSNRKWAWVAVLVSCAAVGLLAWRIQPSPAIPELRLTRFTADSGLTTTPAVSPDGQLIAYASDRAGNDNLDIWIQHRVGGGPIRITQAATNEYDPSFSPDGSQIAYAASDGIFIVPALGGESRRVTKDGSRPRFSSDGKRLMYFAGRVPFGSVLVVDIASNAQIRLGKELPRPRAAVWSPDGRYILIETLADAGSDSVWHPGLWWLVPLPNGQPVKLGVSLGQPEQWVGANTILYIDEVIRTRSWHQDNQSDMGLVEVSTSRGRFSSAPRRLTSSTALLESPSVSLDGTLVLFSGAENSGLWDLAMDANVAKPSRTVQALTRDVSHNGYPSISLDGKRMAFLSDLSGKDKIWIEDFTDGKRRVLTQTTDSEWRPAISPDGTQLAFVVVSADAANHSDIVDISSFEQPAAPRQICDCFMIWDWLPDHKAVLGGRYRRKGSTTADLVPVNGGTAFIYLQDPKGIFHSHVSPDGKWVIFGIQNLVSGIHIASVVEGKPEANEHWKTLVKGQADMYRWSPDGNTVYFTSTRDGFTCIWAQRLNPATKDPIGEPFPIYHSHGARRSMRNLSDSGAIGLGVARDKIVFAEGERSGNIWIGKLASFRN